MFGLPFFFSIRAEVAVKLHGAEIQAPDWLGITFFDVEFLGVPRGSYLHVMELHCLSLVAAGAEFHRSFAVGAHHGK
jgi:hypothetical protein